MSRGRRIIRVRVEGQVLARVPYGGLTYELVRAKLYPANKSHIIATYRVIGLK